jgi:hypothetical protein
MIMSPETVAGSISGNTIPVSGMAVGATTAVAAGAAWVGATVVVVVPQALRTIDVIIIITISRVIFRTISNSPFVDISYYSNLIRIPGGV